MKMKIISCVLVSSILFSIGCYNTQTITREQLQATAKERLNAEQLDVTVIMKDSLEYRFVKDNYRIQGDTLTGFGVQTIGDSERSFQGSIAFADITSLRTTEFSLAKTIIAASLPFAAFGVFVLILASSLSGR
jgi:hypothetical protein